MKGCHQRKQQSQPSNAGQCHDLLQADSGDPYRIPNPRSEQRKSMEKPLNHARHLAQVPFVDIKWLAQHLDNVTSQFVALALKD